MFIQAVILSNKKEEHRNKNFNKILSIDTHFCTAHVKQEWGKSMNLFNPTFSPLVISTSTNRITDTFTILNLLNCNLRPRKRNLS